MKRRLRIYQMHSQLNHNFDLNHLTILQQTLLVTSSGLRNKIIDEILLQLILSDKKSVLLPKNIQLLREFYPLEHIKGYLTKIAGDSLCNAEAMLELLNKHKDLNVLRQLWLVNYFDSWQDMPIWLSQNYPGLGAMAEEGLLKKINLQQSTAIDGIVKNTILHFAPDSLPVIEELL